MALDSIHPPGEVVAVASEQALTIMVVLGLGVIQAGLRNIQRVGLAVASHETINIMRILVSKTLMGRWETGYVRTTHGERKAHKAGESSLSSRTMTLTIQELCNGMAS